MKTLSVMEAVETFARMAVGYIAEQHEALEAAALVVERQAKRIIGHYQTDTGPFAEWRPLAPSTVAEKERLGYAPPDNPLLRTGDLRDSIAHEASATRAIVGSDEDVAVWQELGTATIPPRSFLGAAAFQKQDEVVEIVAGAAISFLTGGQVAKKLR